LGAAIRLITVVKEEKWNIGRMEGWGNRLSPFFHLSIFPDSDLTTKICETTGALLREKQSISRKKLI
jgi:hypothetical protein